MNVCKNLFHFILVLPLNLIQPTEIKPPRPEFAQFEKYLIGHIQKILKDPLFKLKNKGKDPIKELWTLVLDQIKSDEKYTKLTEEEKKSIENGIFRIHSAFYLRLTQMW